MKHGSKIRLALAPQGLKILYRKFPTNECLNVEDPATWIEASLGLLLADSPKDNPGDYITTH